jgi:hypothetical protein
MLTGPSAARNGVIPKSPLGTASANLIHPNLVTLLPPTPLHGLSH